MLEVSPTHRMDLTLRFLCRTDMPGVVQARSPFSTRSIGTQNSSSERLTPMLHSVQMQRTMANRTLDHVSSFGDQYERLNDSRIRDILLSREICKQAGGLFQTISYADRWEYDHSRTATAGRVQCEISIVRSIVAAALRGGVSGIFAANAAYGKECETMRTKNRSKGFTLMELLIVVALIAVLVAVAIPTFTNSLKKAKQAAELSNARSAYSAAMLRIMLDGIDCEYLRTQYWIDTDDAFTSGNKTYTPIIVIGDYSDSDEAMNNLYISVVAKNGETVAKEGATETYAEYRKADFANVSG